MTIDTDRFKETLVERRERLHATIQHHDHRGDDHDRRGRGARGSSSNDNHLADTASETYERELDEGLEEDAREPAARGRGGARPDRGGDVRHLRRLRQEDPARAARGGSVDDALHR